jgi:hypothetical protein
MNQKIKNLFKLKLAIQHAAAMATIFFVTYFGTMEASMAGSSFSDQGNALYKAMNEHLMLKGICHDDQSCHNLHQIFREDGGEHVYFNMYGQKNKDLASVVVAFLVSSGLKITDGMPITLRVFEGPKTQYLGIKSMIGKSQEIIKLEIKK